MAPEQAVQIAETYGVGGDFALSAKRCSQATAKFGANGLPAP